MWTPEAITALVVAITALISAVTAIVHSLNTRRKVAAGTLTGPPPGYRPGP